MNPNTMYENQGGAKLKKYIHPNIKSVNALRKETIQMVGPPDAAVEGVEMHVTHIVMGEQFLYEAIHGARLSYNSNTRSDSVLDHNKVTLGEADILLLRKLITGSSGEQKCMYCVPVSMRVTASTIFWAHMDQYTFIVTQSASLMHKGRKTSAFSHSDFDPAYHSPDLDRSITHLNEAFTKWVDSGQPANRTSDLWLVWQGLIPRSFLYERQLYTNLQSLRHMYRQRCHHRLDDWHRFFSILKAEMPHSWLLDYAK